MRRTGRPAPADEYYLEARDAVLSAARAQVPRGRRRLRTEDGATIYVDWRTPLRVLLLTLILRVPGEDGFTSFSFQRHGRVSLGGNRGIPFGQALAAGHEPWASRQELMDLAVQIRDAQLS